MAKTTLKSRLRPIAIAAPETAHRALLKTGVDILAVAKQLVPVDTSSLKDSGGVVPVSSTEVHVGFGGPGVYHQNREPEKYAIHVEYGTSQSPAQPFLRPAFMQAEQTFKQRLKEEINKLI
jgi:HK97 gp10 family phage protein